MDELGKYVDLLLTTPLSSPLPPPPPCHSEFMCNIDCDNYPDTCVNEQLYKRQAELMVSEGYLEAGLVITSLPFRPRERLSHPPPLP